MNFSNYIKYSGCVEYSPNCNYLAVTKGKSLVIYETNKLQVLTKYQFQSDISNIKFSPDSEYILIIIQRTNQCEIRSLLNDNYICTINESYFGISNCIWSPESQKILTIANYNIKLSIWYLTEINSNTNKTLQYILYPKFSNKGLKFTSDGSFMALAERKDSKDYIGIYYTSDYSLMSHFIVNTNDLQDILWSNDNTSIIIYDTFSECKMSIYSPTGDLLFLNEAYKNNFGIYNVSISPNGHYITCGYGDGKIRLFSYINFKLAVFEHNNINEETIKNNKVHIFKENNNNNFSEIEFSNKLLLTSNYKNKNSGNDNNIKFMEYSYDSNYLASKLENLPNVLFIWQMTSLNLCNILIFDTNITDFKWSPYEHKLIICTIKTVLYIFTLNNIYTIELPPLFNEFNINSIKWNLDGRNFLLCDKKKFLIAFSEIDEY